MEIGGYARERVMVDPVGTYDFASPVGVLKAMDLAMRQYFGADNWLAIRRKFIPGLRR